MSDANNFMLKSRATCNLTIYMKNDVIKIHAKKQETKKTWETSKWLLLQTVKT